MKDCKDDLETTWRQLPVLGNRVAESRAMGLLAQLLNPRCSSPDFHKRKGVGIMFRCLNLQATKPGRGRTIRCGFGVMLLFVVTATGFAQKDPGIRGGPAGAGQPFG